MGLTHRYFAGVRLLAVLLLFGTVASHAASSFSFSKLQLGSGGPDNRVFTAGDRIVPVAQIESNVWYKVIVRDSAGAVRNPSFACTPSQAFATNDNSYVVQSSDTLSTTAPYSFIIEEFASGACSGAPMLSATQNFYVVAVASYTDPLLSATTNRYTTNQTAYLRVLGLPPNTPQWSLTWVLPNGSNSCSNTSGTDRPGAGVDGTLPTNSVLAYAPTTGSTNLWNKSTNYDGGCLPFAFTNQGQWKLKLQLNPSNFVTLPAFVLSNDCAPPILFLNPQNSAACVGTPASFSVFATGTNLTYQWRRNGTNLTNGGTISGATTATLNISSVVATNAANYDVVIVGDCGSITSAVATLTVGLYSACSITGPGAACVNAGNLNFSAPVGMVGYLWAVSSNAAIAGSASSSNVTVTPIAPGTFTLTLMFTNSGTCVTNCSRTITNLAATSVLLSNRTVCPNAATVFTAITNGAGPFTFAWRKDGVLISGQTNSTLTASNVATYTVEVTGACGSATNSATLSLNTLLTPQSIANQTVCSGNTITFSTTPSGSGPLTFQWRKNGTAISGATSSVLTLTNVAVSAAGAYSVVVIGPCNSVTNGQATLTVNSGVTATPMTNLVRSIGGTAIFSTTASGGSGPITYAWSRDGVVIPNESSNRLVITNPGVNDSGTYTVTATAGCSATNSATLLVASCFQSLDVMLVIDRSSSMLGQPYTDARTAATNLVRSLLLSTNGDYAGLVSYNPTSTLNQKLTNSIPALEQSISALPQAAQGTCIGCGITNAQGELTSIRHRSGALPVMILLSDGVPHDNNDSPSNSLYVAAQAKSNGTRIFTVGFGGVDPAFMASIASSPQDFFLATNSSQLSSVFAAISSILCRGPANVIGPTPTNVVVCAGANVNFDVAATGCFDFTYQWSKDGVLLAGETNGVLSRPNVTLDDAGFYSVAVMSSCGNVTNGATLTVNGPAEILIGPSSVTRCSGATASFNVNATGSGLTYQWRKGFTTLPGETNSTLTLTNVSTADAGLYVVTVGGTCGTPVSTSALLTVNTPPVLSPMDNQTSCPNSVVVFQTTPTGTGPFTFLWRKNGVQIPNATTNTLVLGPLSQSDAATYRIEVTGPCGSATNTALLAVLTNTSVTIGGDMTRCVGDSTAFTATVAGSGPFTFSWRKNGGVIPGQTGPSLVLNTLTTNDSAVYSVEVMGACNSATNSATLLVNELTAATPLMDVTACPGETVVFATTARGTAPFTFVWRKDGQLITGATNTSLSFSNVAASSGGTFAVEVTGACGSVTNTAALVMRQMVSATPLSNATRCFGDSVTFSTTPSGTGPFTFVWCKNGGVILGETNSSLSLNNVTTNDAGVYSVSVGGTCGSVTNNATLIVNELTTAGPLTNMTVCVGQMVSLTTTAQGTGPFTFVWRKDGVLLASKTNSSLKIANVTTNDAGIYTLEVSGTCNSVTNSSVLTVRALTTATPLANATRCAGDSVIFSTIPGGAGPFTFLWRKNGGVIPNETNASLLLNSVSTNDTGWYSVEVIGACDSVMNTATLTVNELTTISPLANATACLGGSASFTTTAHGAGPFTFVWRKDGTLLSSQTNSTLNLTSIATNDAGVYTVEVSGTCNSVTNSAALTVRALTSATPISNATRCTGEAVTFNTIPGGAGPFIFVWRKNGGVIPGETNASLLLNNITTNDAGAYSVEVIGACNSVTNSAALIVNELTTAAPLANASVCGGSSVSFTTVAHGTGPFTFVWRKDGELLDGITNTSLFISNVTAASSGTYAVEVTGACGSATNSATLLLRALTTATALSDATRCVGEGVTFSTLANGAAPITFVWRKDGALLAGETNSSLNIASVATNSAGIYTVEVFGACDSVTNSAVLTVREPTTATPLTDAARCTGDAVTFSTTASGAGPFTFVWRRNGILIPGETNSTLIFNVTTNDGGSYAAEITGLCNAVTNRATLVVNEPTTATPLTDATMCTGDLISFVTTPSGTGPFRFAWRKDGQVITSATNSSLVLSNVSVSNDGTYAVEVSGACNSVTNTAVLVVRALTTATALVDATRCAGESVTFSTVPGGTGPFTFLWRKDGAVLSSETNSSLTIANVATSHAGLYSVEVRGACGAQTNSGTLTINAPISAARFTNVSGCEGAPAILGASVSGSGPLTFVWRKDGLVLSGETNAMLTINLATNTSAGLYTREVYGPCNAVTNTASLTVSSAPTALTDQTQCEGANAVFSTSVSGPGPFTFTWRKNGALLNGETNNTLTLVNLQMNDEATYRVEVTGPCGPKTNSATLTVAQKLSATPLVDQSRCVGENTSFSTVASGAGPFSYVWRKDGVLLNGQTNFSITLTNITLGSAARYSVEVTGACGSVTNSAYLEVNTIPLVSGLTNTIGCAGQDITLVPTISGSGNYLNVWRRNGVVLTGETNATLTITVLNTTKTGTYSIEVTGSCGSATNAAVLTMRTNVSVAALASQTRCSGANATFTAAISGSAPFSVVWKKGGVVISNATTSVLSLTNLSPADSAIYSVEVIGPCNTATASALLTVEGPTIATPLPDTMVCAGQTATFSTVASGGGAPFTFVWRRNGNIIAGQTNNSLVLNNTTVSQSDTYSVEVIGCTRVTNSALLTVCTLANATLPPKITACSCADLIIDPMITGAGPISCVWKKNGAILPGETNFVLNLHSLNTASPGVFTVEVTGHCNSITRSTTLEVVNTTSGVWTSTNEIIVPEFGPAMLYPSPILVQCAPQPITKLRVTLFGLVHSYPDDLDILLVSPTGTAIKLMSDCGGDVDMGTRADLIFDDNAPGKLPDSSLIVSGTYKPSDFDGGDADAFQPPAPPTANATQLSAFYGANPNGVWSLYVVDDHGRDDGSLKGWSLDFGSDGFVFPNVSLTKPQMLPDGSFQMELRGDPNKRYYIEASTDFKQWNIIQTNQLNGASMTITDTTASQFNYRFYRASGCRDN